MTIQQQYYKEKKNFIDNTTTIQQGEKTSMIIQQQYYKEKKNFIDNTTTIQQGEKKLQ